MDLWELITVLFRRWYLTVPLLMATGVGMVVASNGVAPTYTAGIGGVFLEPVITLEPEEVAPNPWGQAGVGTTAAAVVGGATGQSVRDAFEAAGLSEDYDVLLDTRSVLFTSTASAETPEDATATLNFLIQTMRDDLRSKQAEYDVPADQQMTIEMFTEVSLVSTRDGLSRVLIVVGGLGLVGTLAVVLVADSLVTTRRVRRGKGAAEGEAGGGVEARAKPEHARA